MDDLIARLEAASGPDQKLDAEIFLVLHPEWRDYPRADAGGQVAWMTPDHGRAWLSTEYTSSIDAALKLVPDRLMVSMTIGFDKSNTVANVKTGSIANPVTKEWSGCSRHGAALALCAAALKARQAAGA